MLPRGKLKQLHMYMCVENIENYIPMKGFDPKLATNNF